MPPPPTLPDELIEEVFMRLPQDEPACLVRASLASKHWFGVLTAPAFRNRYYGAPSMLGFFYSPGSVEEGLFVSTTEFVARIPSVDEDEDEDEDEDDYDGSSRRKEEYWEYSGSEAWDCRHGRVVLAYRGMDVSPTNLFCLDPVTGRLSELDMPEDHDSHGAAVLCTVRGCHHRTCHEGSYQVVVVGVDINNGDSVAYAYCRKDECSRPCSEWSQPCPGLNLGFDAIVQPMPPVLTQEALCFMLVHHDNNGRVGILKYSLRSKSLSLIDTPLIETNIANNAILMGMEDGSLGFAYLDGSTLSVWSRKMGPDGTMAWSQRRVVNLEKLLPIQNHKQTIRLIGSVEGSNIIFVTTDLGIYEISLKSLEWKKIWKREKFRALVPYMSFHDPSEDDSL